jgi:DNA-binding phage protein
MTQRKAERDFVDQLRGAIRADGRSLNQLERDCGVSHDRISRFLRKQRDLNGDAINRLCETLGLELAPKKTTRSKGKGT